jgi:tripartite-type tricarboxylate transporter receptor subunit TctC
MISTRASRSISSCRTDAGGGYAAYANTLAPFLSAHLPGRPRIVVQYMPGAGGIRAMNYLYSAAPKDGTRIAMVHAMSPYAPLFGVEAARNTIHAR